MSLTYWLIGGFPSLSIGAIAINDMTATIGHKPHANQSIATFKLREGML